jgi:succinate dehydrogenase / fumarate reductase, membrane anchor subunit
MVNRHVAGAHYGLRDWLVQRGTAVVMTVYTLVLLAVLVSAPKVDYTEWRLLFVSQWMKLATLLYLVCLFWHAWIGVRNIFMDYIRNSALRLALHTAAIAWLVVCAGWSAQILWGVK